MTNVVALVGRPNTGKSTLFNRLTRSRQAIVDATAGVTRDRNYGKSEWNGFTFSVIDTGGYVDNSKDIYENEIKKQVLLAIDEADVILFLVDGREGINPMDEDIARILRTSVKPIYLVVNKIDSPINYNDQMEFYALGMEHLFAVSAASGSGTGELLDSVVQHFNQKEESEETDNLPKIAVVGRPNVGKSSIINVFLGKERHIVSHLSGTTRDSIFSRYKAFGFDFNLIDTAGLRKKKNVDEDIEFYSVMRTVRTIENSDVCIVMCDATQGFESQDLNILSLAQRNKKGIVIVVNKWDLIEKSNNTVKEFEKAILNKIAPANDVPIIFTSVIKKQRIYNVIETAIEVYQNMKRKITTSEVNNTLLEIVKDNPPPMQKDKVIRIKYITQLPTAYPQFVFFCNLPQYVREDYKRFIENKIRAIWNFRGSPVDIYFRKK
ncbi:MAG TPA: ribosome biogenesis GTPase Der [Bacteroidales bacterium]|jgi:GTP-binding protein|nr:ribosome biogenesis GTPase Der [Bacteroidales bacterium]HOF17111.1 ribosome biogenesis GTPase Der [Bacteroidales bacterium]HON19887.1 ribosome biogenesis GTPase Der [Bacteroidales bacterium]HOR82141.1 ribosome biogenesis GTPase Der [Bacteroidales bacterium]HPJ91459.1 ribosome biogenesis GTPase Der [Bacteroidales bacterium]